MKALKRGREENIRTKTKMFCNFCFLKHADILARTSKVCALSRMESHNKILTKVSYHHQMLICPLHIFLSLSLVNFEVICHIFWNFCASSATELHTAINSSGHQLCKGSLRNKLRAFLQVNIEQLMINHNMHNNEDGDGQLKTNIWQMIV